MNTLSMRWREYCARNRRNSVSKLAAAGSATSSVPAIRPMLRSAAGTSASRWVAIVATRRCRSSSRWIVSSGVPDAQASTRSGLSASRRSVSTRQPSPTRGRSRAACG
jgi:hypothetical protein